MVVFILPHFRKIFFTVLKLEIEHDFHRIKFEGASLRKNVGGFTVRFICTSSDYGLYFIRNISEGHNSVKM